MLNSELYAPRPEAMDSFTASFSSSQEKSPYFSGYGEGFPGSGFPRTPYSPFPPYYANNIFGLFSNPYGNPYASGINGYFNDPPYFYHDYYNHPYPLPHPEFHGLRGPHASLRIQNPNPGRDYNNQLSTGTGKYDKTKSGNTKESHTVNNDDKNESGNRYIDGNNLISENRKEVGAQRASSLTTNNERDQTEDYQFKISQLPPPTYKVISVGGQPVGPDYPLPESYTRAKLLEQIAAVQNLVKSLVPALTPPQINKAQDFRSMSSEYIPHMSGVATKDKENSMASPMKKDYYLMEGNHQVKMNDGGYFPVISTPTVDPNDPRIYGSEEGDLPSKDSANPSNQYLFNADLAYDEEREDDAGKKSEEESEDEIEDRERNVEPIFVQSNSMRKKTSGQQMYAVISNAPKTTSSSVSERSQSGFIHSENIRPVIEETSESIQGQSPSSSSSSSLSSLSRDPPYRSEENYQNIRGRVQIVGNSYNRGQNVAHGVPQAFSYHITKMQPFSRAGKQQEATNLEDVNFGIEQGKNKG